MGDGEFSFSGQVQSHVDQAESNCPTHSAKNTGRWISPSDNLGIQFLLLPVRAREIWSADDFE